MPVTLGKRLELLIKKMNINQSEFAELSGLKRAVISSYIRDINLPRAETLTLWANQFKIDIHWLLTGEGEPFLAPPAPEAAAVQAGAETIELLKKAVEAQERTIALQDKILDDEKERRSCLERELERARGEIERLERQISALNNHEFMSTPVKTDEAKI